MKLLNLFKPTWWINGDKIVVNNKPYKIDPKSDRDLPMHSRGTHQISIDDERGTAFVTRGNKYSGG